MPKVLRSFFCLILTFSILSEPSMAGMLNPSHQGRQMIRRELFFEQAFSLRAVKFRHSFCAPIHVLLNRFGGLKLLPAMGQMDGKPHQYLFDGQEGGSSSGDVQPTNMDLSGMTKEMQELI